MSTEPIRWGILGTSHINEKLLRGARSIDSADVVAVASRSAATGERFAAAHGIARVHQGYEALLADPDIEAVYIPLPNSLHHAWTMQAIAAGKHVLCEKPYSRRPQEVDEAWDAAEAAGVVLHGGLHVAPHATGRAPDGAGRGHRRAGARAFDLQLPPGGGLQHPREGRARRRLAHGRGLLLRVRLAAGGRGGA